MAEFEGKMSLDKETSELEVCGKFKLTDDELSAVVGGVDDPRMQEMEYGLLRQLLEIVFAPLADTVKKGEEGRYSIEP